jgi:nicotinamide riboside kinase
LPLIAAGQASWEDWYTGRAGRFLICDTDWTVIRVWNAYRFGISWPEIKQVPAVYYFLCAPDFPWAPDPLREHPEERDVLYGLYASLLDQTGAAYSVLSGSPAHRLQTALAILSSF